MNSTHYTHYSQVRFADVPKFVLVQVQTMLDREGEWSDDKDDHPTKYGIRQQTADIAGYRGNLRDLTITDAAKIWILHWYYLSLIHI